ncbi:hypothetical protein E2C01_082589 [Portunus trituberculatus]|uniref:Uncharacterized protein n=1 Tax=Portunus trituberculatus TaxID=210409 RepID=A0A5B7J241_PORTR|nr:hypothetical protein [Portunus trituberculatus]
MTISPRPWEGPREGHAQGSLARGVSDTCSPEKDGNSNEGKNMLTEKITLRKLNRRGNSDIGGGDVAARRREGEGRGNDNTDSTLALGEEQRRWRRYDTECSVVRLRAGHLTHVLREGIDYRRVGVPQCEFWVTCPGLGGSLGPLITRREPPLPRQ